MIAADVNNMARNKSPLPKNTVAKNWSSCCAETITQHADEP